MGFKDMVAADLDCTFLNLMEFAETRDIDGRPMRVVVDDHSLVERGGAEYTEGIYSVKLLIYVSAAEYGARPKQGKLLTMDGRDYRIAKVEEDMGLYTFTLEANRA